MKILGKCNNFQFDRIVVGRTHKKLLCNCYILRLFYFIYKRTWIIVLRTHSRITSQFEFSVKHPNFRPLNNFFFKFRPNRFSVITYEYNKSVHLKTTRLECKPAALPVQPPDGREGGGWRGGGWIVFTHNYSATRHLFLSYLPEPYSFTRIVSGIKWGLIKSNLRWIWNVLIFSWLKLLYCWIFKKIVNCWILLNSGRTVTLRHVTSDSRFKSTYLFFQARILKEIIKYREIKKLLTSLTLHWDYGWDVFMSF